VFTVQTADFVVGSASLTGSATITEVADLKTILIGGYIADDTADNNNPIPHVFLDDPTVPGQWDTVSATRHIGDGAITLTVFVIEFTGGDIVQRGVFAGGATSPETTALSPAVGATRMAWTPATTSFKNTSGAGSGSKDNMEVQYLLDFETTSLLRFYHLPTTPPGTDNDISWEVIEWDDVPGGPAPTRRLMVVA